jgi:hypothetical protein
MWYAVPTELDDEHRAVEAEIRAAFRGVTREGGVSWSETIAIDFGRTTEERAAARAADTDRSWEELVDGTDKADRQRGGMASFFDAIGMRYYLPVLMIRDLRGDDGGAMDSLFWCEPLLEYRLKQWSLLDDPQRKVIVRFLRFSIARAGAYGDERSWARVAYDGCWREFDPEPLPVLPPPRVRLRLVKHRPNSEGESPKG